MLPNGNGGLRTPTPTRRYRIAPEPARGWPVDKTLGPADFSR